jgi:hypothetical protein
MAGICRKLPTVVCHGDDRTCQAGNRRPNARRTISGAAVQRASPAGARRRLYSSANGEIHSLCSSCMGRHLPMISGATGRNGCYGGIWQSDSSLRSGGSSRDIFERNCRGPRPVAFRKARAKLAGEE